MMVTHFSVQLPPWLMDAVARRPTLLDSLEHQMAWVIGLASANGQHGTGGPFAAAVFDARTNELISVGVNLVLSTQLSSAHAELVALSLAQRATDQFSLATHDWRLVSSAEPCSMCTGAIHWSGIRSLAYGARGADVCRVGFDEGDKPFDWAQRLVKRGMHIVGDVDRDAAVRVLLEYAASGGPIYSPSVPPGH